jgi:two-component system response regulator YesN
MGCTFKEYVTNMRMSFADGLIKNGETSVSAIARMCGYTDPLYFSRVFSESRGISPKVAIKNHKAELNSINKNDSE